jgi:hypothetical protein
VDIPTSAPPQAPTNFSEGDHASHHQYVVGRLLLEDRAEAVSEQLVERVV